ncbi:hypothetical protein ACSFA3_11715 [Variovorax sp. RHLX14]|uniref:hypothetical protein n=1 Tax=Variovorax sp. RHLX14 TaxID=1259731 RepID=UPI003F48BA1D
MNKAEKSEETEKISDFTLHDAMGNVMLDKDWLNWLEEHGQGFGPTIFYSWNVGKDQNRAHADRKKETWEVLPDKSGFICIQSEWIPNNCVLLNAYGKERMRLTVPWQLTKPQNPKSADPPTSFALVSDPYINPADGKPGQFGITAWVEHAGKYYFELDFHSGQFLWGREIRD